MSLYHFTDPSNISSIKKYGLLSWLQLLERYIYHLPASNDFSQNLDKSKNLENYIRLCLTPNHPMADAALYYGRIKRLVWLQIDDYVLSKPDTLFSNDNATSNRAIINNNYFTALNSLSSQAEVLAKTHIDIQYIIFPTENGSNNPFILPNDDLPF